MSQEPETIPKKIDEELREAVGRKPPRSTRIKYSSKPGFVWNPLLKYPDNAKCVCNSGKKFKKCQKKTISPTVKEEEAPALIAYVKKVKSEGLNR